MSGLLASQQRTALSDAWTITPVGGSDKVTTFVSLLGSQKKMKVATLIDWCLCRSLLIRRAVTLGR